MALNRTVTYGYKIEGGKLTINTDEQKVVVQIYEKYAEGYSYKNIATWLTEQGVRYMPQKPAWNKNMVARILQNNNYLGNEKYMAIIDCAIYQSAQTQAKTYTHTESEDVKILKPLLVCHNCNEPIRRRLKTSGEERWYCPNDTRHIDIELTDEMLLESILKLQQDLIAHKQYEVSTGSHQNLSVELIRIKNQIDLALSDENPNIEEIKNIMMSLASEKYHILDDVDFATSKQGYIIESLPHDKLDSRAIKEICRQIKVSHIKATQIILKGRETMPI